MNPYEYLAFAKNVFIENGDPLQAQGQMRYMRNQFEYYGLKAKEWMALAKDFFAENGTFDGQELQAFARLCFADEHREIHYFALEMVQKMLKKQPEDFIHFIEELITTRSWWDTVDWLATKMAGIHLRRFPHLIKPVTEHWMTSGNIWLHRACLIFQLNYKDKTDFNLMTSYILRLAHSREFFIQKGAGWALRQYSKTAPHTVTSFIQNNPHLPALTKREGMKWLNNQKKL